MKIIAGLVLFWLGFSTTDQGAKQDISGRTLEITVVKADDLSPVPWPAGHIEIKPASATISPEKNIYMLLQDMGIAPDSEAFALVYDLNPAIKSLNSLPPKTSLQVPSVADESQLRRLQRSHDLIELVLDPDIRRDLKERTEALEGLLPSVNQESLDSTTQEQVKSLAGWYEQIERRFRRKTDPPLRRATLIELSSEGEALVTILKSALSMHRKLTPSEKEQVGTIYEDIKVEIGQYGQILAGMTPTAQNFYAVTVNIKEVDATLNNHVRVYYTYNGLFPASAALPPTKSWGFSRLGSGVSENLLMKNYVIWAARDGDSGHPLTPPYRLRIESVSPPSLTVDLSFASGAK